MSSRQAFFNFSIMETFNLQSQHKKILADTITPVSAYLKIRDVFPHSLLLESSDYHANNKNFSYICCNPIASITLKNKQLTIHYPNGKVLNEILDENADIASVLINFHNNSKVKIILLSS